MLRATLRPANASCRMPSRDDLQSTFEKALASGGDHLHQELAHRHMLALADMFEGWSLDRRRTPTESAKLLGWAEGMRRMADKVGPDWDPPEPIRLSAIAFIGRVATGEK